MFHRLSSNCYLPRNLCGNRGVCSKLLFSVRRTFDKFFSFFRNSLWLVVISSNVNNKPSQSLLWEIYLKIWINQSSQWKHLKCRRVCFLISKAEGQIFLSVRVHKKWRLNLFMFLFPFLSKALWNCFFFL